MRRIYIGGRLGPGEMISFRKKVAEKMGLNTDDVIITAVCVHYVDEPSCDGKCAFNDNNERLNPSFKAFFYLKDDIEAKFVDKMPEELKDDYFKLCALDGIDDSKWLYSWYINGKRRYLDNQDGTWLVDNIEEKEI